MEIDKALLNFSDYVAVSTYPYIFFRNQPHSSDPSALPSDWFRAMQKLAPGKPLVIAETGYIAEDLIMESFNLKLKGTTEWQYSYLELLFQEMNELNALFIIWFIYRDYDAAWQKIEQWGYPEYHKTWKDTGLVDEQGRKRSAFILWDQWYSRSLLKQPD